MKILLTMLGDLAGKQGGMENVLCKLANNMVSRGHEVTIMAFGSTPGMPFYELNPKVTYLNPGLNNKIKRTLINVTNIFFTDRHKKEYRRDMYVCKNMASIITEKCKDALKPDIVVAFDIKSLVVMKDFLQLSCPVISLFRFDPETVLENPYYYKHFEKADAIQVLMPSYEGIVRKYLRVKKIVCIPNVIPQFEECTDWQNKTIICVGRIERNQKRQHLLIEAFALLKDRFPDWKIEFWGDYDVDKKYYSEMQRFIKGNDMDRYVAFCGTTKNIAEKLQKASIFAMPSAYEGFSNAMGEAMAMGLPAIGFKDAPGVNELIVNEENGLLVDGDTKEFAVELEKLMISMDLRKDYGVFAREYVKKFKADTIWQIWEQFFIDVDIDFKI